MTFVKHQARVGLALLVAMLFLVGMVACEDPGTSDPGTDPGVAPEGEVPGF